ncbi:hypothetical protein THRCLA_21118, partial [Thraustotheca clavata]
RPVVGGMVNVLNYEMSCIGTSPIQSKVTPNRQNCIVSAFMSGLVFEKSFDVTSVCKYDVANAKVCPQYLTNSINFANNFVSGINSTLKSQVDDSYHLLVALNISFMIYAKTSPGASLALLTTTVFQPSDPEFNYFSWSYLYDWIVGYREVISFQGDSGNMTLLTDIEIPLMQQIQSWEVTGNFAQYCRVGVWYATWVMLSVAVVAALYMVGSKGNFEGRNMFKLNRVGGMVWVGRPLLILRSLTALCLLSTRSLNLEYSSYFSYFEIPITPWYEVLLASWEVAWFNIVVDDIFLVCTREYLKYYVTANTVIVWLIAYFSATLAPVEPHFFVSKHCSLVEIDLAVVCQSGDIQVGKLGRILFLIAITFASSFGCYVAARWANGRVDPTEVNSRLLSSGARYLFIHKNRTIDGVYHLDRASAMLNGIITYRHRQTIYAIDIKLWRILVANVSDSTNANRSTDILANSYPIILTN